MMEAEDDEALGGGVVGMDRQVPRIGVGAVIVDEAGRILLVLRKRQPEAGKWSIPGGKVELFERLEETAVREIREEVGLTIEVDRLLCLAQTLDEEAGVHWVSPIYLARVIGGEARNLEPEAQADVRWFALHELPENLAAFTVPAVEALKGERV
jgi:8-oxo-dGTP diphosphatase